MAEEEIAIEEKDDGVVEEIPIEEGKTDWACWLGAEALFDDQPDIISETHH